MYVISVFDIPTQPLNQALSHQHLPYFALRANSSCSFGTVSCDTNADGMMIQHEVLSLHGEDCAVERAPLSSVSQHSFTSIHLLINLTGDWGTDQAHG